MNRCRTSLILTMCGGFLLAGWACSSFDAARDMEERVARHMAAADSLERAGDFRTALLEYGLVAQHYAGSNSYAAAVHRAAVLSLDPRNPASNDSLAMYWLDAYLRIPNDPPSADDARIQIGLLRRAAAMQTSLERVRAETDSLTLVIRRQNSVAATQTQRLLEAEAQLKQAQEELARLKQVDVQLSRTRRTR